MKKLAIATLISLCFMAFQSTVAQDNDKMLSRKEERLARKNAKAAEFEQEKEQVAQLAEARSFILEANTLSGKFGYNAISVGANNYLLIDTTNFVLQTSAPGYIGQNGIGGLTIRGTIESYKVTHGAKNTINIIAQVNTFGLGPATITFNLVGLQNCNATFSTASGLVLNMAGSVSSISDSKVFEGMRMY